MRNVLVQLHRWFGLFIAGFLIVAGLTGAIISWDHELDEWLNPHLFNNRSEGEPLPPLKLVEIVENSDARVRASLFPMTAEPGHNTEIWVDAKLDPATGRRFELDYDHVFIDPITGDIVGRRLWGKVSLHPEHLMSFLYKLHYSLHLPEWRGRDAWGVWLMGGVALIWLIDTFIAFALTLPRKSRLADKGWWRRWRPSWLIRGDSGAHKLHFDLHRAGGLWTLGLILILAFTSFSLNLYREVFYPAMSLVSQTTPGPFETRTPQPLQQPVEPRVGWTQLLAMGREEAARRGWREPVGAMFYSDDYVVSGIHFFYPGADHDSGGMAVKSLYYDGLDGRFLGDRIPWSGTAADVFVQLQFPLHSGRILGLPGRIMISVMGLVVTMLSVTGFVIWERKRRARRLSARKRETKRAVSLTSV